MTAKAVLDAQTPGKDHGPPRRHRRRRWLITGVAVLVVLVVLVAVSRRAQPNPPPLALPTAGAAAPAQAGAIDGTWNVGAGSVAGFRVRQTLLGMSTDVVGRTNTVTGTITVSQNRLTAAAVRIDLTTIKVKDRTAPQFVKSLETDRHPSATLTLTEPVTLTSDANTGATVTTTATGQLMLHGVTRRVTFTTTGRHSGSALEATGSIPITFSDWDIEPPRNYGLIGSLTDHGVAEFLLILHRQ